MNTIKAIETHYQGRRFRSRLEARWSIFFDALKIPYDYELEGFELPSGRYLPDFWMPNQDCWIEIKPSRANERESKLAAELSEMTGKSVFIFESPIKPVLVPPWEAIWSDVPCASFFIDGQHADDEYCWCRCHQCGAMGITFNGRSNRLPCKDRENYPCELMDGHTDKGYNVSDYQMRHAFAIATGARFEFGEKG